MRHVFSLLHAGLLMIRITVTSCRSGGGRAIEGQLKDKVIYQPTPTESSRRKFNLNCSSGLALLVPQFKKFKLGDCSGWYGTQSGYSSKFDWPMARRPKARVKGDHAFTVIACAPQHTCNHIEDSTVHIIPHPITLSTTAIIFSTTN